VPAIDRTRASARRLRHRVELPDDQGAAAVGLHHLHLEVVAKTDAVLGAERHQVNVRRQV
jgi:hypothetical protein